MTVWNPVVCLHPDVGKPTFVDRILFQARISCAGAFPGDPEQIGKYFW